MDSSRTQVIAFDALADDAKGLTVTVTIRRPGLGNYLGHRPNVDDLPGDVRAALLSWLHS